jgi:hypothetical protein
MCSFPNNSVAGLSPFMAPLAESCAAPDRERRLFQPLAGGSQILMALSLYHPARMLRSWRALARVRGDDRRKAQIEPWVIHDIRRTMRTGLSALPVTLRAKAPAGRAALPRPHSLAPLQAS